MAPSGTHLLLVPSPGWGHSRPLYALAARIVAEREDVIVTILITSFNFDKSRFEIDRQFETGSKALPRIRLISISHLPEADMMKAMGLLEKSYPAAYDTLVQSKPITCATTGTSFEAVAAPSAVIMDFFTLLPLLKATRSLTGHSVPVIAYSTGSGANLIRSWGPESMGGWGDLGSKTDAEAARLDKPPLEVGEQLYRGTNGSIIRIPGVPAMYDYEFFPQEMPFKFPLSQLVRMCYEFLVDSDALLMVSSDAYEHETLDAVRSWFSKLEKPVYVVGPLVPTEYASTDLDNNNNKDTDIAAFLDRAVEQNGRRSLVFISFGSQLWPNNVEHLEEVIDALIEKDTPFILSCASPYGKVSNELSQKIQSSGLGLLTQWSPQQFILNHPATGWFLTHGGHGGITESLASGIPLICWPFFGDQPTTAAHATENLKVAFELFEVRTGTDGLKPLHRNELTPKGTREAVGTEIRRVLEVCFGKEGEERRKNAERLRKEFLANWEGNGASRIELKHFLETYAQA